MEKLFKRNALWFIVVNQVSLDPHYFFFAKYSGKFPRHWTLEVGIRTPKQNREHAK